MKIKTNWFPLFATNFLAVVNDNILKTLIIFVGVTWIGEQGRTSLVAAAGALLVVPFIFFSPIAGRMAVKYKKSKIIKITKLAEIPIMIIASFGFVIESIYVVLFAMFLMGLQSCFLSPSKYGIIRDIGGINGISFGTGAMEMITFIGVLLATFFGGYISDLNNNLFIIIVVIMIISALGYISSLSINPKESNPEKESYNTLNPFLFPIEMYKKSKQIKGLNYSILGLSSFWFIGALVQSNLYYYCPNVLNLSNTATGIVMSIVAIGIGLGCYMAGIWSHNKVNLKLVTIGGVGMTISMLMIVFMNPEAIVFTILIVIFAFFSGLFKIPLNSFIQTNVKGRQLGEVIAYNNQMLFIAILIGSVVFKPIADYNSVAVFGLVVIVIILLTLLLSVKLQNRQVNV